MKIGLLSSTNNSPSSWYRAFGAFTYLAREHDIEIMTGGHWDWENLAYLDALVLHCAASDEFLELAKLARQMRVPLWVDHDDHMFDVPIGNQAREYVMSLRVQGNIRQIMDMAQLVTVSTPALVGAMCDRAHVVPNAFNDYAWRFSDDPPMKRVTWRGGPAHMADLQVYGPAIGRVAARHPEWQFHFLGLIHWDLPKHMPEGSFIVHRWSGINDYFDTLNQIRPAVHIVPMVRTPFNECKSNCCWLEATAAGACVVAPAWPEWDRPGILRYGREEEFEEVLERALASDQTPRRQQSREHIENGLLLSQVNEERFALLSALTTNKGARQNEQLE